MKRPTPQAPAYEPPEEDRPASAAPEELTEPQDGHKHDPYAAWRFANYRLYVTGLIFATVAGQMQAVALGWEVFKGTHSMLAMGWLGLAEAVPLLLLALPAGHLADRLDRRKLCIYSQLAVAACAVGLAVLSYYRTSIPSMIPTYAMLLLGSAAGAFGRPARAGLLPQIIPGRVFGNAVTWQSSMFELSSVIGPMIGGVLAAQCSRMFHSYFLVYVLVAVCMLVWAMMLGLLRVKPIERAREAATLASLLAGVRFVWRTKTILATITLDLFAVLLGGATYLLPPAAEKLGLGEIGFAILRAAPACGAVSMALCLAHRPPLKHAGRTLLWAVAGFGAATIVFGLSEWAWLSVLMLYMTGVCDNVSVVVRHTLVQLLTPDEMRGRVSAVNAVFIGASNQIGGFESGLTGHMFGFVRSVVGGGIGTILVVLAVAAKWPQIRRIGSLHDVKPEAAEPVASPA